MNSWKRIFRYIKNPFKIILYFAVRGRLNFISDRVLVKLMYFNRLNKRLDLNNPKTFNEKLQWLKLYNRNPIYTSLVDKFEVRKYISKTIGREYLIPLLGVYDNFDSIDFDVLPDKFVLKCTHDSGGIVICDNKSIFDVEFARKKLNKCLARNYYWIGREWPYKNVKPRIICEKYMVDESGSELKDYKIFCFKGIPKIIQVDYNRFKGHKRNLYDTNWNYIPASIKYPTDPKVKIKKPEELDKMLNLAGILAMDFPHVRIDFYYIEKKVYFGEMTFYHGAGFEKFSPESLGEVMGNWIELPTE